MLHSLLFALYDSGNTAQKNGDKGKRTSDRLEPGTYTLSRSFSHKPLVPVANPTSPIAFCTWDRWLVAEAPRKSVGPGLEPGRWSFFPCCHSSEQCFQNHYRALATPAYIELPTSFLFVCL